MIIDNRNNSSNEYGTWLSFEAILLNDSESEIISLDKMDGELILTCRLVNVRKQFILEVVLRNPVTSSYTNSVIMICTRLLLRLEIRGVSSSWLYLLSHQVNKITTMNLVI